MKNELTIVRQFIERVLNGGNVEATGTTFGKMSWKKCFCRDKDLASAV